MTDIYLHFLCAHYRLSGNAPVVCWERFLAGARKETRATTLPFRLRVDTKFGASTLASTTASVTCRPECSGFAAVAHLASFSDEPTRFKFDAMAATAASLAVNDVECRGSQCVGLRAEMRGVCKRFGCMRLAEIDVTRVPSKCLRSGAIGRLSNSNEGPSEEIVCGRARSM